MLFRRKSHVKEYRSRSVVVLTPFLWFLLDSDHAECFGFAYAEEVEKAIVFTDDAAAMSQIRWMQTKI